MFTSTLDAECGTVTKCELLVPDCSSAYTGDNLVIEESTGKITSKQDTDAGWTDTVCV